MDGQERTEVPDDAAPPGQASDPPAVLLIVLWIPVFAVVLWFMVRLFSGRWIEAPRHPPGPLHPPEEPVEHDLGDDPRRRDVRDDASEPLADDERPG